MLVMLLGQSRVFYSMSKDGLLPKFFSSIHSKYRTPWKTNIFFMIFVSIFASLEPGKLKTKHKHKLMNLKKPIDLLIVPISDLGHMVSIGTLFAFSLVCIGVLVLRKYSRIFIVLILSLLLIKGTKESAITNNILVRPRPENFKTPFTPVIPILGVLTCVGLIPFCFTLPLPL